MSIANRNAHNGLYVINTMEVEVEESDVLKKFLCNRTLTIIHAAFLSWLFAGA